MPYAISTVARKVSRLNLIAKFMRVKSLTVPILAAELETAALLLIDEEYVDCPSYYFQVSSIMKEDNLIIDPDNLKISGDRVFKAYDKSQMAKATPVTENLAFQSNDDTNLLLWWFLIGCRVDTLQCIEEAHVQEKHGYTEIYLTKEKVFLHGGRKIKLGCNCDATHQNEYCFRHNSNRKRPDLPIPAQRIKEVLKRYGLSGHSCRRGLALSIAWTIAREGRLIPIMDVLRHFGWANVSEQFENYSNDFLAFSRARWFPCEAVLSIFTNSSGGFVKLRSMPNLKQIKDNETDDGCKLPFTATLEQSREARLQANDLALPVHTSKLGLEVANLSLPSSIQTKEQNTNSTIAINTPRKILNENPVHKNNSKTLPKKSKIASGKSTKAQSKHLLDGFKPTRQEMLQKGITCERCLQRFSADGKVSASKNATRHFLCKKEGQVCAVDMSKEQIIKLFGANNII